LAGIADQRRRWCRLVILFFAALLLAGFLRGAFFGVFLLDFLAAKYRFIGSK
jgi:hypothetical protein